MSCSKYCYTASVTDKNSTVYVVRNCADNSDACPDPEKVCSELNKLNKNSVKACAAACCKTDKCNNFTPSSATGIVVAKITLILMVIAGVFAA